jgi:anti-sigma factor RsiW
VSSDHEKRMTQYLLGQLSEEEQTELERQYLADDALFEELAAAEDDLRDAYARGELSGPDRKAFEQRLLSVPGQQTQQEFAGSLCRYLKETENKGTEPVRQPVSFTYLTPMQTASRWKSLLGPLAACPRWVFVSAVSMILLALLAGSWWRRSTSIHPPPSSQAASGNTPGGAPSKGGAAAGIRTMGFALNRGLVRGGEESELLLIPAEVTQVRLEARIEADYPRYQAVLQTVDSKQIWSKRDLEAEAFPGGKRVLLTVSSSLLSSGDYILTVRGQPTAGSAQTVAEYAFRVRQR